MKLILIFTFTIGLCSLIDCLFEDQAGTYDWLDIDFIFIILFLCLFYLK
jgi:hypothetical protein